MRETAQSLLFDAALWLTAFTPGDCRIVKTGLPAQFFPILYVG